MHASIASSSSGFFAPDLNSLPYHAVLAQLGERQTEDLKVPGSIPGLGILSRL